MHNYAQRMVYRKNSNSKFNNLNIKSEYIKFILSKPVKKSIFTGDTV